MSKKENKIIRVECHGCGYTDDALDFDPYLKIYNDDLCCPRCGATDLDTSKVKLVHVLYLRVGHDLHDLVMGEVDTERAALPRGRTVSMADTVRRLLYEALRVREEEIAAR